MVALKAAEATPTWHRPGVDWTFWPRTNWAAVAVANVLLRGQRAQVALVVAQGCEAWCE